MQSIFEREKVATSRRQQHRSLNLCKNFGPEQAKLIEAFTDSKEHSNERLAKHDIVESDRALLHAR
jgi:hypothetical protein